MEPGRVTETRSERPRPGLVACVYFHSNEELLKYFKTGFQYTELNFRKILEKSF